MELLGITRPGIIRERIVNRLYMPCPGITKIIAIPLHHVTSFMNDPLLTRQKCHQDQCENLSRISVRSSGNTFALLGTSCHRWSWSIRFASPSSVGAKLCRPNQSDEQCEEPQPTKTKVERGLTEAR